MENNVCKFIIYAIGQILNCSNSISSVGVYTGQ